MAKLKYIAASAKYPFKRPSAYRPTSPPGISGIPSLFEQAGILKMDVVAYPTFQANGKELLAANPDMRNQYKGHIKVSW